MKTYTYTCKNIHDRDGHSKEEIMSPIELKKAIEKWLENNSFQSALKEEGVWMFDQTYGRSVYVEIDTRSGEITTGTTTPNQYGNSDSFFITLASRSLFEEDNDDILGDDDRLIVSEELFDEWIDHSCCYVDDEDYKQEQRNENGTFTVIFRDFNDSAESYVEFWSERISSFADWDSRIECCEDYYLENVGDDWEEKVDEFYNDCNYEETDDEDELTKNLDECDTYNI